MFRLNFSLEIPLVSKLFVYSSIPRYYYDGKNMQTCFEYDFNKCTYKNRIRWLCVLDMSDERCVF